MAEPLTLYKLIILYMLKKIDFPLTNSQISEFILDKGYTTYFKLQQAISELIESAKFTSTKIIGSVSSFYLDRALIALSRDLSILFSALSKSFFISFLDLSDNSCPVLSLVEDSKSSHSFLLFK